MTICVECSNNIPKTLSTGGSRCKANFKIEMDFVYGEQKIYEFCRSINKKGNCKDFIKKEL